MSNSDRICVVTGVGPGNGASISRKFAQEGYRVIMLARSVERLQGIEKQIPNSISIPTNVGDREVVRRTFEMIRKEIGKVSVLVHNAGSGQFKDFLNTSPEDFEQSWRVNALGLLLCGQEAARDMLELGGGAIVAIGATASWRGGIKTAPFASAKAAQRSLAQSMAKSLGPQNIHVAYAIIDGMIDVPQTRANFPDRPENSFLNPDRIADTVFYLAHQDPTAWTFELDLRPSVESW
jgi:NAD(P)-dependent dehydrogenase (short-subunit alcohol dehydrogenase family)